MSTAAELIAIVERNGGRFKIDGDRLGIVPKSAAAPVLEELRRHKPEIIDLLLRRPPMPAGVRLIHWEPKEAPVRLSEYATVTHPEFFIRTTLAQLDAHLRGEKWLDGGWGLSGLLGSLAACGCVVELEDRRRAMQ
jgi:hypothetical protein